MEKKRYKLCGLVCKGTRVLAMSLCGALFCGAGLLSSALYGVFCALVGFGFWFFASGFMPDAEGKSWLLFAPFTALCAVGSVLFGRGVSHIFFFVAAIAMSLLSFTEKRDALPRLSFDFSVYPRLRVYL